MRYQYIVLSPSPDHPTPVIRPVCFFFSCGNVMGPPLTPVQAPRLFPFTNPLFCSNRKLGEAYIGTTSGDISNTCIIIFCLLHCAFQIQVIPHCQLENLITGMYILYIEAIISQPPPYIACDEIPNNQSNRNRTGKRFYVEI